MFAHRNLHTPNQLLLGLSDSGKIITIDSYKLLTIYDTIVNYALSRQETHTGTPVCYLCDQSSIADFSL